MSLELCASALSSSPRLARNRSSVSLPARTALAALYGGLTTPFSPTLTAPASMASKKHKMDAFQLKGIRQILKITATYVDRSYTNEYVIKKASEALRSLRPKAPGQTRSKSFKRSRRVVAFSKVRQAAGL